MPSECSDGCLLGALVPGEGWGIAEAAQVSRDPRVKAFILESAADGRFGKGALRKKAPRPVASLLAALEDVVVDLEVPTYQRMFAFWKLCKAWGCLRFDDHRGWLQHCTTVTRRGLSTVLVRTKTSGADKAVEALPFSIATGAYLRRPDWLQVGFDLWQRHAAGERDYFLTMPTGDLSGVVYKEAKYQEAAAMSRALLTQLRFDGEELITPVASLFWSEHSERAFLPSAATLLGFDKTWVDTLGRWQGDQSESYVRVHRQRVERIQVRVAMAIRKGRGGPDIIDEDDTLDLLAKHLRSRGQSDEEARRTAEGLAWFDASLQEWDLVNLPDPHSQTGSGPASSSAPARGALDDAGLGLPPLEDSEPAEQMALEDAAHPTDDDDRPLAPDSSMTRAVERSSGPADPRGYVVSISKSGFRRLHYVGACYRAPGVDYRNFEVLGPEAPEPDKYHTYCRQCWKGSGPDGSASDSSSSLSSRGSEGSDSSEEGTPVGVEGLDGPSEEPELQADS